MTEAFCGPDPAISPIVPWMDLKETTSVSDYRFVELRSNGLGPIESDMAVGGQAAGDGRPMTIRGRRFGKGFGTRIPSQGESRRCLIVELGK